MIKRANPKGFALFLSVPYNRDDPSKTTGKAVRAMQTQQRNTGLDALRLLSMAMVVLHHILTHGGLLFAFADGVLTGEIVRVLNALVFCAVNVYAILTGYGMSQASFKLSRWLLLWVQTVATGLVITAGFALFSGETLTGANWLQALLPVTHDTYWYFTAYTGVFVLIPVLNMALERFTSRQLGVLLAALMMLFSVLPLAGFDPFRLGGGYHMLWLAVLYLLGGAFRKYGFGKMGKYGLALYLAGSLLGWVLEPMMSYTSPAMVLAAAGLAAAFAGWNLPEGMGRLFTKLAPLSFGVYLIHEQPLIRQNLIYMRFDALKNLSPIRLGAALMASWIGIFAACLALEWCRAKLFGALGVKRLCERVDEKVCGRFERA